MRVRGLAPMVVLTLLVAGLGVGSATTLAVDGGRLTVLDGGRCTASGHTVTVTRDRGWFGLWSTMSFSLPEACRNLPIEVTRGALFLPDATVRLPDGDADGHVTVSFSQPSGASDVYLVVDGWHIPVSVR